AKAASRARAGCKRSEGQTKTGGREASSLRRNLLIPFSRSAPASRNAAFLGELGSRGAPLYFSDPVIAAGRFLAFCRPCVIFREFSLCRPLRPSHPPTFGASSATLPPASRSSRLNASPARFTA